MDRGSFLASLGRRASFGIVVGVCAMGCAGTGPPIVEHPSSPSMTFVAPERGALAGALTFPPPSDDTRPTSPRRRTVISATRPRMRAATAHRAPLHVADWSLSLGTDEASPSVAPEVALSAALSMSAGPAPRLVPAPEGAIVVPVSAVSVEEGAWERRRR